jgi:hypothetical protein
MPTPGLSGFAFSPISPTFAPMANSWEKLTRQLVGGYEQASDARTALNALAQEYLKKKAGLVLQEAQPNPPQEPDTADFPKAYGIKDLHSILSGLYPGALQEYMDILATQNLSWPPQLLPDLFNRCLQEPELWFQARPLVSSTGFWLLGLNPDWHQLELEVDWHLADANTRLQEARRLRAHHPETALQLIQSTWQTEPASFRLSLLQTLEIGLSEADQTFLEAALSDKSQAVGQLAAGLLLRLPGRQVQQDLISMAQSLLDAPKPIECAFPFLKKCQTAPEQLACLLAVVSPKQLNKSLKPTDPQFENQLQGACFHRDREFILNAVDILLDAGNADLWSEETSFLLLEALPYADWERSILKLIQADIFDIEQKSPVLKSLGMRSENWSEKLYLELLNRYMQVPGNPYMQPDPVGLRQVLEHGAYRCSPENILGAIRTIQESHKLVGKQESFLFHLWNIFGFRARMHEHFK